MKIIGLLGGMSWESTSVYYRLINEGLRARLGGLHSAKVVLYSVDFAEVEELQHAGDWTQATRLIVDGAQRVERAGADFLVICTNTMHKMATAVQAAIAIPLLHIGDATGAHVQAAGVSRVGLLGTKFTMGEQFYQERLTGTYGLDVLIPETHEREAIHRVIYEELCQGKITAHSRHRFQQIMEHLVARGAEGIILGCTEISLLVTPADCSVALFDTTQIHATTAVDWALQKLAIP